ncbi:MAG: hypothetical protein H6726_21870 [Sandaracinaceae bacterium]|nr:hypothetical protein [Sandaracinaceae bacterium]
MGLGGTARAQRARQGASRRITALAVGGWLAVLHAGSAWAQTPDAGDSPGGDVGEETTPAPPHDGAWDDQDPDAGVESTPAPPDDGRWRDPDEGGGVAVRPPTPPARKHVFPVGFDVGWRGDGRTNAAVLGGELSVVWFSPERSMFGGPADGSTGFGLVFGAVWVSRPSHFRGSVGLEVMRFFSEGMVAGIDASATFHTRGDPVGFRTRAFLGGYGMMLYLGLDYHGRAGGEAGAMVKFPLGA